MSDASKPRRPVLRYHGGKWKLAEWIIGHFPNHLVYVEPFGGAASVLLQKDRSKAEIYNDLDDGVVNLFRVLQSERGAQRLIRAIKLTPFSRREFQKARHDTKDPVERARRMIIRAFMGFGSNAHNEAGYHFRGTIRWPSTGFRSHSHQSGTTPALDWSNYPEALARIVDRFIGVVIEHDDAFKLFERHDAPDTLWYLDPPYHPDTRQVIKKKGKPGYLSYRHDMTSADHVALLERIKTLQGSVVLSGYANELYAEALPGWVRHDRASRADGGKQRVESLWLNPRCERLAPSGRLI